MISKGLAKSVGQKIRQRNLFLFDETACGEPARRQQTKHRADARCRGELNRIALNTVRDWL